MNLLIQPITPFPLSLLDFIIEGSMLAGIGIMFVTLLKAWPAIPEQVGIHFGPDGMPDRWGSKKNLLLLPVLAVFLYLFLTIAVWVPTDFQSPWLVNQRDFPLIIVEILKLEMVWAFVILTHKIVYVAQGKAQGLGQGFTLGFLMALMATVFIMIFGFILLGIMSRR